MIKFYKSNYDEFDSSVNGGAITSTQIETGVLHSMIPRVRPRIAETGGDRWFKMFMSSDEDILSIGVDIAKVSDSPSEEIYLSFASSDDVEDDIDKDNARIFGGFVIDSLDETNKKITADREVTNFVTGGDFVTFYDGNLVRLTALEVDSINENEIVVKEWGNVSLNAGNTASSTLLFDSIDKDANVAVWIKQEIKPFTEAMEEPADSFSLNIWYDIK